MPPRPIAHRLAALTLLASLMAGCAPAGPGAVTPPATGPATAAPAAPANLRGPLPYAVVGDRLAVWDGTRHRPIFLKGVNLGVGTPGHSPGDLAPTRADYDRWLPQMAEMGFNCIRIYTLLPPHFYDAIAAYNGAHADAPLYVLHGVWLEEENPANDLVAMAPAFDQAIAEVIDALHGRATIPERPGRASGRFTTDISPWVLAWVIGREIAPPEVEGTDKAHPTATSFSGAAFRLPAGTPSEAWAAARLDRTVTYERATYGVQRPVSLSSWPTLDPLKHPTENPDHSYEDVAAIDVVKVKPVDAPAGLFASFHAYPYYPDFMIDQPDYQAGRDADGPNPYAAYLAALKAHHAGMPVLVAEVGVPSSWGNAHEGPPGLSHGGLDEVQQGQGDARLMRAVHDGGLAGAVLFAWFDEWWKRTWIVDELAMPRDRYPIWHNVASPEQNFGLVGFALPAPVFGPWPGGAPAGRIREVQAAADAAYFRLRLTLDAPLAAGETLTIGYDTYADDRGELVLPGGRRSARRHELALTLTAPGEAQLHVTQAYDLFGIWHGTAGPAQQFRSTATDGAPWVPVRWKNGEAHTSPDGSRTFPASAQDIGRLRVRAAGAAPTSLDAVVLDGATVEVRLPWTLLQFTDPSARRVMDDDRATPGRETAESEGVAVAVALGGDLVETARFAWAPWDRAPATTEYMKAGAPIVAATARTLPSWLP